MRSRLLAVPAALALSLTLTACGEDDVATDVGSGQTETDGQTQPDGPCLYLPNGSGGTDVNLPPAEPMVSGTVEVTLDTSVGELALTLDADRTPCTVNSFVSLADQGYFDGTDCHRLTDWGVLQCGDPTGTGAGGPGYRFADELDRTETYPAGTLAMANAGADTNGSQFFLLYADTGLPAQYTVFGSVDDATVQLVADVAADGSTPEGDGAPNTPVAITAVSVDD